MARFFLLLLVFSVLSGCISLSSGPDSPGSHNSIELADTPFFPQTEYHCGPAALATALGAENHSVDSVALANSVYVPGIQGSLQPELLAAARQEGFIPVVLPPDFESLVRTLELGKPVIVLQNLGTPGNPFWHYAVLVGYDYKKSRVYLRSGTTRRKEYRNWRFQQSWNWAGNWAVVLLRHDETIDTIDKERYLHTLAELEQTRHQLLANRAYTAARGRWPQSPIVLTGLGNTAYQLGDTRSAEEAFKALLKNDKGNLVATNNLAHLLLERDCVDRAYALVDPIYQAMDRGHELFPSVSSTWQDVQTRMLQDNLQTCSQ